MVECNRQQHLRHTQTENDVAYRRQFEQRKFQTNREHQKHHSELGQRMGCDIVVGK